MIHPGGGKLIHIPLHAAYDLGVVEKAEKRHTQTFCLMLAGMLLSGVLLWFTKALADEPRELLYILFWFAGETLCDYLFLTGYELRRDRRLAGRLASIKVVFSESYETPNYSKSDVDRLYSEIEKDVNKTILEKEPLRRLAADGQLKAYEHNGFWKCMDTKREMEQLEEMIERNEAPWMLWKK